MKRWVLILALIASPVGAAVTVQPDSVTADSGNWTAATAANLDEGVDARDGTWAYTDTDSGAQLTVDFPTPGETPGTGTDAHVIRVYVWMARVNGASSPTANTPDFDIAVYEAGTLRATLATAVTVSNNAILSYPFTYSGFSNADGSELEVRIVENGNGFSDANERHVAVDAVEWVVNGSAPADKPCTHIIGYSQTCDWYCTGGFEAAPGIDPDEWQLMHNSGAGVTQYSDPGYGGWDNPVTLVDDTATACTGATITRVLYNVAASQCETDSTYFEPYIDDVIDIINTNYASATEILLQPTMGGPDGGTCDAAVGSTCSAPNNVYIKETIIHPPIATAVVDVAAYPGNADVEVGYEDAWVDNCTDYADDVGHLTTGEPQTRLGDKVGDFYAAFDAEPDTPIPTLSGVTLDGASIR